jgi:hypothetical protein
MNRKVCSSIAAMAALLTAMAGCDATGNARHVPDADLARTSLQTALTAWRDGRPCEPIAGPPAIQVSDSRWRDGQQIAAFEIGEEQADGDETRQFPVKLTFKKTGKVEEVRYVVHGREPVWVYSDTDYKRLIDMGNGEDTGRAPTARRRGR